ncbi:T9SS type A sorting domain-containing protein [Desertivirga xinjiangensis]|uniref:T9SS type A sorting domain-containing protein n=1 Tax=Desertivirga xinjiangensis TaxID=539206 RepID=UPI00210B99F9|nr:T9SS type A sorting domain-containing protein [Pedobacter xinjiangensis]
MRKSLLITFILTLPVLVARAQSKPVVIEAESATLGSDWTTATISPVTYITAATDVNNNSYPGIDQKVATYSITFPAPGEYRLYIRIRVASTSNGGASDDSFYYGNGFGTKAAASGNDWITVNGLNIAGFNAADDAVNGSGTTGVGASVWKWVNLSQNKYTGETPINFTVPNGALTQTFQIGSRENGLDIDKIAFGLADNIYTVSNLDNITEGTLPVSIAAFTGRTAARGNLLNWKTSLERNSSHFEILRSNDNASFRSIGTVSAAGHSDIGKEYNFTDNSALSENNYYQLKQVDFDGQSEFYGPVFIRSAPGPTVNTLTVTLAENQLRVLFESDRNQSGSFTVTNTYGSKVTTLKTPLHAGTNEVTIPVILQPGIYILNVTCEGFSGAKKFIKQ